MIIREYYRLYTKIMLRNKFVALWYLIFPIIGFFAYNYDWITNKPSLHLFYMQTSIFTAYITFSMSVSITSALISMRENGFMKVFNFISGSKGSIIIGKILNQFTFIFLAILLFSFVVSVYILNDPKSIALFIISSVFACLFSAIPVTLLFLSIMLVNIKQETIFTILNIYLLILVIISFQNITYTSSWSGVLLFLNPLELVRNITFVISEMITGTYITSYRLDILVVCILLYIIIGIVSIRFIKVVSSIQRT